VNVAILEKVSQTLELSGNAPVEVFPFVSILHCEVILRHKDGESQDIEMTPDEADQLADMLKKAAARSRELKEEQKA
jgi:hypothetical protein